MKYKNVAVSDLIEYVNNARTHSAEQINKIAASMGEFGVIAPVIVDQDNHILAGHGRLMAAKKLKLDEVPCLAVEHLSDAQKKAYILADNRIQLDSEWDKDLLQIEMESLSEMDFDLELTGFDDIEINDLLQLDQMEGMCDADDVPELQEETVSKKGDVWLCGDSRVMCGDSTSIDDVEKLLNGRTIDLIFSDPPYGVSYADKNKFLNKLDKGNRIQKEIQNDHMSTEETAQLWSDVFSLWSQYLSDYSCYYIAAPLGIDLLMMMRMMQENGFPLKHTLVWNKNNHVLGRADYHYKHEPIFYGWSKRHKFFGRGDHKNTVWDIPKPLKNDLHPTMKPVALVENCVLNSSESNQIVSDMFLGSGTTLIAAEKNNRICYGMELDEHYCDVIVRRWQEFTGKNAVLESTGQIFNEVEHG